MYKDQLLNIFITSYRRGPKGFVTTKDAFYLRGDVALQRMKIVDDVLLYDENYLTHLCCINEVLTRCRTHGIALKAEKFVLAASAVIDSQGMALLWTHIFTTFNPAVSTVLQTDASRQI